MAMACAPHSLAFPLLLIFNVFLLLKYYHPAISLWQNQTPLYNVERENCEKEQLAYGWSIYENATGQMRVARGKQFDCKFVPQLHKFQLSDSSPMAPTYFRARPPQEPGGAVFVTAGNVKLYNSVRALIASIKRTFGRHQRIILYDLGGIRRNNAMMSELNSICRLEVRAFNFEQLPKNLRGLRTFTWKVLILAEVYSELDTFIYCDTSVHFLRGNFSKHFELLNSGQVSPFLFMMGTYHGIRHATLPETFDFLPLYLANQVDIEMQEANFMIVQKSEFSRQILKWALLCALTRECIEPRKVPWDCPEAVFHSNRRFGLCHRMDQSVLSILVQNAEAQILGRANGTSELLISHFDYNHPSHRLIQHLLVRGQHTQEDIDKLYSC